MAFSSKRLTCRRDEQQKKVEQERLDACGGRGTFVRPMGFPCALCSPSSENDSSRTPMELRYIRL